jgi:hypothetical protein
MKAREVLIMKSLLLTTAMGALALAVISLAIALT